MPCETGSIRDQRRCGIEPHTIFPDRGKSRARMGEKAQGVVADGGAGAEQNHRDGLQRNRMITDCRKASVPSRAVSAPRAR